MDTSPKMAITGEQFINSMCRTCMHELVEVSPYEDNSTTEHQWLSILDRIDECGALRIAELLSNAIPRIEVHLNDEMPKKICSKCLQQLLSVYRFQQLCLQTDQELRGLIAKSNTVLYTNTTERTVAKEIITNDPSAQDFITPAKQQIIEIGCVKVLAIEAEISDADPLKTISKANQNKRSIMVDDASAYTEDEMMNDDRNVEYSDNETLLSTVSVKNETMIELEQVNLASVSHSCHICNRSFNKSRFLKTHLKCHRKNDEMMRPEKTDDALKCNICSRSFNKQKSLDKHRLVHDKKTDKVQSHPCELCKKMYSSSLTLERHKRLRHSTVSTTIGSKSRKDSNLNSSKNKIHESKQHICNICGIAFIQPYELKNHKKIHSGERPHQMCTQSDQQMGALIATESTDAKLPTTEGYMQDEINNIKPLSHEFILEASEHRIEFGRINALPELPPASAADPLKNIDVVFERDEYEPDDLNVFVKNGPIFDDEHSAENSEEESLASAKKKFIAETAGEQVRPPTTRTQSLHNELPRVACNICRKTFCKASSLHTHTRKYHSTENPQKSLEQLLHCDMCDEMYSTQSKLAKHKKSQHSTGKQQKPLKQYKCAQCDEICRTYFELAQHKKLRHPTEKPQKHPCDICGKIFKTREGLLAHVRRHKSDRQYLCTECGKSFRNTSTLKQHITRHSAEKPFECPYCPSKFSCPGDVSNHKVIHEGIKRHICDICGYSFIKSNQLTMHKRYHNNIKPYKCDYCEMRFPRASAQRRHMRTHTGEKPYKCKYCQRAFAQSGDQKKHLRIHLGDNVYRCKLCPLAYPSDNERRLHYATHKNDDADTRERNMKALLEEEAKLQLKFAQLAKKSEREVERTPPPEVLSCGSSVQCNKQL